MFYTKSLPQDWETNLIYLIHRHKAESWATWGDKRICSKWKNKTKTQKKNKPPRETVQINGHKDIQWTQEKTGRTQWKVKQRDRKNIYEKNQSSLKNKIIIKNKNNRGSQQRIIWCRRKDHLSGRQASGNHPKTVKEKERNNNKNEDSLCDLWQNIKYTHYRKFQKTERERIIKPILRNNDWKLINQTKETDLKVQKVQSVSNKITQRDPHQDIL